MSFRFQARIGIALADIQFSKWRTLNALGLVKRAIKRLARSTKKIKSSETSVTGDGEEPMNEVAAPEHDKGTPKQFCFEKPSWRDIVIGRKKNHGRGFLKGDEFGDLDANDGLIEISTKENWPCLTTSKEYMAVLERRWNKSLIIKLLGRSIGYKTL